MFGDSKKKANILQVNQFQLPKNERHESSRQSLCGLMVVDHGLSPLWYDPHVGAHVGKPSLLADAWWCFSGYFCQIDSDR